MNWIRTQDEFPKANIKVLFVNINEFSGESEIRLGAKYEGTGWYSVDAYEDEIFKITHWMYLPKNNK